MRTVIELDKSDLIYILSKHFNTTSDKIEIGVTQETRGYGMGEYIDTMVKVKIIKEGE